MTPTNDQLADALRELMELLYVHGGALPYNAVINIRKRLDPPCPTTPNASIATPPTTITDSAMSALTAEPSPEPILREPARDAQWSLPPRPEKSAAREPQPPRRMRANPHYSAIYGNPHAVEHDENCECPTGIPCSPVFDGSGVGSGGTSGFGSPASTPCASTATDSTDQTTDSQPATSTTPAADPVGVPEWLTVGIEPPIIGDKRIVVMSFPGVQRGVRLWSDSDALHLVNIVNAGIRALRQHHERVVAGLKSQLRNVEDAPIARLQLPDGTVPANTVDAAQQWYAEANRVMADRDSLRERCERAERERDHWKAMCEGHETFKEALDTPSSPTVTAKGERWKRGKDIYELVNGRPEFIHTPTQDRFQSTDYPTESDLRAAVARGELVRVERATT